MLTFPAPSANVMAQGSKIKRVVEYRREAMVQVSYEGVSLEVTPGLASAKAAIEFGMPVAVTQGDIERTYGQHLKWERFRAFCAEDGIDPLTCERDDGETIGVYQPDGMGYPTLVLQKDKDGNFID